MTSKTDTKPFDPLAKSRYFVLDPNMREVAGKPITDKARKEGLDLTETEARSYIAAGALSTKNPAEDAGAKEALKTNTVSADVVEKTTPAEPTPAPIGADPTAADKARERAAAKTRS